jgi:hypothetical protein
MTIIQGFCTLWKNSTKKQAHATECVSPQTARPSNEKESKNEYNTEVRLAPKTSPTGPFRNFPHAVPKTAEEAARDVNAEASPLPASDKNSRPMVGIRRIGTAVAAEVRV